MLRVQQAALAAVRDADVVGTAIKHPISNIRASDVKGIEGLKAHLVPKLVPLKATYSPVQTAQSRDQQPARGTQRQPMEAGGKKQSRPCVVRPRMSFPGSPTGNRRSECELSVGAGKFT